MATLLQFYVSTMSHCQMATMKHFQIATMTYNHVAKRLHRCHNGHIVIALPYSLALPNVCTSKHEYIAGPSNICNPDIATVPNVHCNKGTAY